ncbi:MAG: GGDEF domain-containing protein, partial [Candidatus Rokubacteria bacterium]|nr:GGDEF domain-containing protein [Candidatus Rokubacteria bacterium]
DHQSAAPAGRRRIAARIATALPAASIVLLLILVYALEAYVRPVLPAGRSAVPLEWLEALLLAAALLTAISWRVARSAARRRPPEIVTAPVPGEAPMADRSDDIGSLMGAFSRMLTTIEEQATEINQFAQRLDTAYQEVELTNARLKEFSFKDEVTGLYNRRFFSIRLEEEVSRYRRFNHPVSVLLLDLDGFKAINDELGHAAGDETLRDMGEILLRYSRGINVICRYGGDEFAVLLVETSKAGARLYADRIRQVLGTHPFAHGRPLTASFGIASLPEDVNPAAEDVIRAADEALYAAKRAGKNRVSVYEDVAPAAGAGPQARLP